MSSPMDALERAGDVPPATETETWRIDAAPKLDIPVDALPGPIRATREGADSDPVVSAEQGFGGSHSLEELGGWRPDRLRATREDADSDPVESPGHGFGGSRGPGEPGERPLHPIRATRDDTDSGPAPQAEHGFGDSHVLEEHDEWRLDPIRTTRDATRADAVATAADELDEPPEPTAPPESTRRRFDPRTLPPRRGAIRAAGALLSLLAVIGAGAAGGYLFWKTQVVRPALVRHLPSMPVAVVDFTPAPDANAATGESEEALAGTPIPRETGAGTSVAGGAVEPSPGFANAHGPILAAGGADAAPVHGAGKKGSGLTSIESDAALVHEAGSAPNSVEKDEARTAVAGDATTDGAEGARRATAAGPLVVDSSRTPAVSGDSSPEAPEDFPSSRAAGVPTPVHPTPVHPTPAHPAPARPTTVRQEPPAGDSMPPAATDVPAGTVAPPETPTRHPGTDSRQRARAGIAIRKRVRAHHVAASLGRAYEAYRTGDAASASEAYRAVLEDEPRNRNALLGLAATAARAGRRDEAAAHYARVLASYPADAIARAGLLAIDERDPARNESALKTLLRREPRAAHLHFDLGNVYAAQSRWAEAQRAYFDACRFNGDNADYAYNLAVSLDHLAQRRGALDFYRKAPRAVACASRGLRHRGGAGAHPRHRSVAHRRRRTRRLLFDDGRRGSGRERPMNSRTHAAPLASATPATRAPAPGTAVVPRGRSQRLSGGSALLLG